MVPVFSTVYFGNLNYFRSIILHDEVLIESKEHFIKQTFRNRCEILTSNGIQQLSVPVIRLNGSKTVINEVEISYATDWRKDHWKAIKSAYSSSPYFEHYGSEVKELIYKNEPNLLKFNDNIQNRILSWLDLPVKLSFSKNYKVIQESIDFRITLNQGTFFKSKKNIPESFQTKSYIQVFGNTASFQDNLSILDAIFCLGPMSRLLIFKEY